MRVLDGPAFPLRRAAVNTERPGGVSPAEQFRQGATCASPAAAIRRPGRCCGRGAGRGSGPGGCPRGGRRDWCDEARAQGAAACGARAISTLAAAFRSTPSSTVASSTPSGPATARSVTYGRRTRPGEAIPDRPAPECPGPDADTLARLAAVLGSLAELDRGLIRQLFWDGRSEDDLAREWGVSPPGRQQA